MEIVQDKECQILIGEDALEGLELLVENLKASSIFILLDDHTKTSCLPLLAKYAPLLLQQAELICIPQGEEAKNIETLVFIWNSLSEANADRHSLLLNLGGGVLGDMGGFAAATYKRGIPFIQIPTTLLAMADASVGGKTGINFRALKNQIGLFSRPQFVFICPLFLKTLSAEHFKSGATEILKMCLLLKDTSWQYFLHEGFHFSEFDIRFLQLSIQMKANIVADDFKEADKRKILNLGHTFGHAFESLALAQERAISHGYAVALGLICELYLSSAILGFSASIQKEIERELLKIFPYFNISENDIRLLITYMLQDKKNKNTLVYPVLLKDIGEPVITQEIKMADIENAFAYYTNLSAR